MDKAKIERKPLRASFTKIANLLEKELAEEDIDQEKVRILVQQLSSKFERMNEVQQRIETMTLDSAEEIEYITEKEAGEEYYDRYIELKTRSDFKNPVSGEVDNISHISHRSHSSHNSRSSFNTADPPEKRKIKLPKLEIKKFTGETTEWLGFWCMFSKIHDDPDIVPQDKFQYLIQAVVPGSRAESLVYSFPPTAENYPKVIEQLKDRFGRTSLLIQVYVRELLSIVMQNTIKEKPKGDLTSLYDNLESHLRALESLGCARDKFADFLTPLIESCIPKSLLQLWQRERMRNDSQQVNSDELLKSLMSFLRAEVNSTELVGMADTGFRSKSIDKENKFGNLKKQKENYKVHTPTAAVLVSTSEKIEHMNKKYSSNCIFCDKPHASTECFKARNMSLEDKKNLLKSKKCCFVCLQPGHMSDNCRRIVRCMFCNDKHYAIMCPSSVKNNVVKTETTEVVSKEPLDNSLTLIAQSSDQRVLLQILTVQISNGTRTMTLTALLDTASERSYISSRVRNELNLSTIRKERAVHSLFGGIRTIPQTHEICRIYLSDENEKFKCNFEVRVQDKICDSLVTVDKVVYELLQKEANCNFSRAYMETTEIDLLVGADIAGQLLTGQIKQLQGGLRAIETKLGWTLIGKIKSKRAHEDVATYMALHVAQSSITDLWKIDILGITDPIETKTKKEAEEDLLIRFQETVEVLPNGRYRVELPWKDNHFSLPSNRELAWKRLQNIIVRLRKEGYIEDYARVLENWKNEGIIELVPDDELDNLAHYLPHRPVIKENNSTTRIRPVFDASAHTKRQLSLNDCLEKGPNLIELIPDILDIFRKNKIGVVSDIEKTFLQMEVATQHRNYLCFFGIDKQIYRHCRVPFGVTSSPFLLGAVLHYHLKHRSMKWEETAKRLRKAFYVDNCITSLTTEQELKTFINEAKLIMSEAGMNLRCWESNVNTSYTNNQKGDVAVLGLLWDLSTDTLRCNISRMLESDHYENITKRVVLSVTQKIFDPIGFTSPVTLLPKLLLQELWTSKLSWDEPLPEDQKQRFEKWRKQIYLMDEICLSRYCGKNDTSQIHTFVDASQKAYAACVYIRSVTEQNDVKVSLIRARARVAPIKKISIPRLELMACCIGARLASAVEKSLDFQPRSSYFWTDSQTALCWIKREGLWNTFVDNRVREIRQISDQQKWRHVPGALNPADLPSRGCIVSQLKQSKWWEGPSWLYQSSEFWPVEIDIDINEDAKMEQRKVNSQTIILLSVEETTVKRWYLNYFSNYNRIICLVAWIYRFVSNSKCKLKSKRIKGKLTGCELEEAEKLLLRVVQGENLDTWKNIPFIVQKGDGLRRLKTRIINRPDSMYFVCPIILFGNHPLTPIVIRYFHHVNYHAGQQILMSLLRQKFWIVGARRLIKKVITECVICRRYRAQNLQVEPTVLPEDRIRDATVFEIIGVDLAGPLILREGRKGWIVLFTCAVYRAIHMELITGLSVEAFLQALRRFIARRGRPRIIYSDNGTNFVGTENAFKSLSWEQLSKDHPGGEGSGRGLRTVKDLLRRVLGTASLNYEELTTTLCDCEAIVNSRPLTYMTENVDDLIPLSPALFLNDPKEFGTPDIDAIEEIRLRRRVQYRAEISQALRRRFRDEYLGQLVEWRKNRKEYRPVEVGEIVLVGDDNKKCQEWILARVTQVYPGKDNKVRRVQLQTAKGILTRPVQRLFPLEIRPSELNSEDTCREGTRISAIKNYVTKRGRVVKVPQRLGLLNQCEYRFVE